MTITIDTNPESVLDRYFLRKKHYVTWSKNVKMACPDSCQLCDKTAASGRVFKQLRLICC